MVVIVLVDIESCGSRVHERRLFLTRIHTFAGEGEPYDVHVPQALPTSDEPRVWSRVRASGESIVYVNIDSMYEFSGLT
jgi:hypothetical protein